ncbi:unnamed protein product [Leptidea sinapis]|uniref:Uncharacterized protein n=1 Tax=Leptidea sinapis TaxID=189913 RepID=A0A5E4QH01_9NEOP|nr:unnamed protein product [Leptidea sinapis]
MLLMPEKERLSTKTLMLTTLETREHNVLFLRDGLYQSIHTTSRDEELCSKDISQRKKKRRRCRFLRKDIVTRVRQHPPSSLQQLWLEVKLPGINIALGTAYRPENISVLEALDALGDSLNSLSRCDFSLAQLVNEPTRITDLSQTILGLVIRDKPLKCKGCWKR